MKRALIHIAILMAIFTIFGTYIGWAYIISNLLLTHTKQGKRISNKIKRGFLIWQYEILDPWWKIHKNASFFKSLESASWFRWYGKRVVYVKAKDSSQLSATQIDVKNAIKQQDYKRALEIVNELPVTPQTTMLKQVIEAKL